MGSKRAICGGFLAPLAVAVFTALASQPATAAGAPGPTPPFGHSGTWITDAEGRAVILHGVNMVFKRAPYYPSAAGFNGADARFLRRHGFDAVRLGVLYQAVEPQPGRYSSGYLSHIARTQRTLSRQGIFSLIDFHQDLFAERFGGEGFPDWAVIDDGLPAAPKPGFPLTYFISPGENEAWTSFWLNRQGPGGVPLQARYAAAWRYVASHFRGSPRVLGYDLINEPWPGVQWPTCANFAGCPLFEQRFLGPMERRAIAGIRRVDRRHLVWYSPTPTTEGGPAYWTPRTGDPRAGLSFHVYCSLTPDIATIASILLLESNCDQGEERSMTDAIARAKANDDTLMMSEFGATSDPAVINRMVDRADRHMVPWLWWHYCGCEDPTTSGPGDEQAIVHDPRRAPTGQNVFHSKLALLDRPYPLAVAGTPESYFYDRDSNTFTLRYSTRAPGGQRLSRNVETVVYVPRIHYPRGYAVQVTGAKVTSAPRARYLNLRRRAGARSVAIEIGPRG